MNQIAVYKGETLLAEGTIRQCAKELHVNMKTIKFYLSPAYERRLALRKSIDKSRFVVRV